MPSKVLKLLVRWQLLVNRVNDRKLSNSSGHTEPANAKKKRKRGHQFEHDRNNYESGERETAML